MTTTGPLLSSKTESLTSGPSSPKIRSEPISSEPDTTTTFGAPLQLTNAQVTLSTAAREPVTETTISILWWVVNSPPSTPSLWNMVVWRSRQNCQREIGCGLPSGCYQCTTNMDSGLLAERLISWRAEETWVTLKNSEEALKLLVRQCIGDQISLPTNTSRLMLRNPSLVAPLLTTSILMVFTGMTKWSTLTLITILTESFLLTTPSRAIGNDQELPTETTLGNIPKTKMPHLTNPSTWFWTWLLEEPTDTSRTESLLSLGLIHQPELHLNSMITKGNGGLLGETIAFSRSIASGYGIWLPRIHQKKSPSPSGNPPFWAPRNDHLNKTTCYKFIYSNLW